MKKVLTVRVEGLKNKPFYGLHKESYSKEMPEDPKVSIFREELLEIQKRYGAIHRIEFIVEKIEIPVPFKGEIDPKLVREVEGEYRKKRREDAHKS